MPVSAANKPQDIQPQYRGEIRAADGYQYWATDEEDDDKTDPDYGSMVGKARLKPTASTQKRGPGLGQRLLKRLAVLVMLAIVAVLAYLVVTFVQIYTAADSGSVPRADAAVVLGAAQYDGAPSPVFVERLNHAYNLWESDQIEFIMTTGANQDGDTTTEGQVGAAYLRGRGVPESALLVIPEGGNTWQQLSASAFQIEARELDSVVLVSDAYHNYRLLDIAEEVGINAAYVSPSTVEPTIGNYVRETVAVSLGRISGYRRLSAVTE